VATLPGYGRTQSLSEPINSFEAQAFNPNVSNVMFSGEIVVDRWAFRFQSPDVNLEIPLPRLKARTGEGDDDRIIFSDPVQAGWEIYTLDERVLEHPGLVASNTVREQLTNEASKRELKKRLKQLAYAVGVCVLLVWLGQIAVSMMVRSLIARIPPKLEQQLGDEGMEELREMVVFSEDKQRVAHLKALAAPLVNALGGRNTNFQFYIIESPDPNAFALPGGHLAVTTGLLEVSERPEQILGTLAHEVAHVTKQHGIRQAIASAGPFVIFRVFMGGSGMTGLFGEASDVLVRNSFSKEYENEADEEGWRVLVAANIDPRGMLETFQKLEEYEVAQGDFHLSQAFSTHPATKERIARLEKKWKQSKQTGYQDLQALRVHLRGAAGQ
jgi:Zn-dependent protease with chaperone function